MKKSKKGRFSKAVVLFVIGANMVFTAAVLAVFLKTGAEPGVLVGAFFSFTTAELWSLASIKKEKEKGNTSND